MTVLSKESVKNFLYDDVSLVLKEKNINFTSKVTITGKGYNHSIDFVIPSTKNGDTLIKTTTKLTKDKLQPILFSYLDIRESKRDINKSLIIYDGREFELKNEDKKAVENYHCEILSLEEVSNYNFI